MIFLNVGCTLLQNNPTKRAVGELLLAWPSPSPWAAFLTQSHLWLGGGCCLHKQPLAQQSWDDAHRGAKVSPGSFTTPGEDGIPKAGCGYGGEHWQWVSLELLCSTFLLRMAFGEMLALKLRGVARCSRVSLCFIWLHKNDWEVINIEELFGFSINIEKPFWA